MDIFDAYFPPTMLVGEYVSKQNGDEVDGLGRIKNVSHNGNIIGYDLDDDSTLYFYKTFLFCSIFDYGRHLTLEEFKAECKTILSDDFTPKNSDEFIFGVDLYIRQKIGQGFTGVTLEYENLNSWTSSSIIDLIEENNFDYEYSENLYNNTRDPSKDYKKFKYIVYFKKDA